MLWQIHPSNFENLDINFNIKFKKVYKTIKKKFYNIYNYYAN